MSEGALREIENWQRARALRQSGAVKDLFLDDGRLKRNGEAMLADLRDFCFAEASTFHKDPQVMAAREGRRQVWLRIIGFLNMDDSQVQKMMEIDDGGL